VSAILVTGVGGGVGQSILKCLHGSGHDVIAADGEALGTGLFAAPKAYRIPYASAPDYIDRLLAICQLERVELLFPGLDAELPVLAAAAPRFREIGVTAVVSSPSVVAMCDDKLATAQFLQSHGFPAPRTYLLDKSITEFLPLPMILKPQRGGARSQGVFVVRSAEELSRCLTTLPLSQYVAQELIVGDEYTCGTVTFDGQCRGAIVMRRILRDGDTYKAFVDKNPTLQEFVRQVVETLKPFGPCNLQMRVKDGTPFIFEFNARCSGTTACRALAGFNEPVMIADFLLSGRQPAYSIREIGFLRYWNELVVDPARLRQMSSAGVLEGDGSRL